MGDFAPAILQLMYDGGWMMWPIALLAIAGFIVGAERALALGRLRLRSRSARRGLDAALEQDRLADLSSATRDPVGRVLAAGVGYLNGTTGQVEAAFEFEARREARRLRRRLGLLSMVVVVSPLCGFLGTATGLLGGFTTASGALAAAHVAAGISEALLTTATGLLVAIPAQLALTTLRTWADRTEGEIEDAVNRVLLHLATSR